jgi:hypothetical protein
VVFAPGVVVVSILLVSLAQAARNRCCPPPDRD